MLSDKTSHIRCNICDYTTASRLPIFWSDCSTWSRQLQNMESQLHIWGKMALQGTIKTQPLPQAPAMLIELNSTFLSGYYAQMFYFCNKYSKYWAFTVKQSCDLKPTAKIISIKTQLSIQLSAHLSWPGSLNPHSQQPPPATSHLWKSSSKRRSFLSSRTPGRGNKIGKENEKKEKQECLFKYRTWITPRKERLEPYYQQGRYLQL